MDVLKTLYRDRAVLVVDKPAGLPLLPDGWAPDAPYVAKMLEADYGRLWIVHRLDKVTSGVVVFARTAEAHRALSMQFERHLAHKVYHALANGVPKWSKRTASAALRSNVGRRHRTVVDARSGKRSRTTFRVLESFRQHCLLEAIPLTGRTHQIRVHASSIGYPLLGDLLYGAPDTELIGRPGLHALELSFTHPDSGEATTFAAPYPDDFMGALRRIRNNKSAK